jgi:hypothetical protein
MKSIIYTILPVLLIGLCCLSACKKLLEIPSPQNQLTTDKVFADSTSATAAMVNVYALFNNTIDVNYNAVMSCYTDELQYSGATQQFIEYNQASVPPSNSTNASFWQNSYFAIYSCNDALAQSQSSSGLSEQLKQQFQGEAKFLRAYAYLNLINTYGSVPLILTTNVNQNSIAASSDSVTVYKQIIQDLLEAKSGLSTSYIGQGKVRANQYAADALLARVYLWQKNWTAAESTSDEVISSALYTPLPNTLSTFTANSLETIFAFYTQFGYIADGPNLVPSSGAPQFFYTNQQLNAFEPGDHRKTDWILTTLVDTTAFYSPYKYHNITPNTSSPEFLIALRAGEQYLIRAEARAELNNLSGAIADLNVIRNRAGLSAYSGLTDKTSIINAVYHERQVELFTEWGNRYSDLKRTGRLSAVNSTIKPDWKNAAIVLPIPQSEINTDPNLKQNQGY